jgi:hypothetical protein
MTVTTVEEMTTTSASVSASPIAVPPARPAGTDWPRTSQERDEVESLLTHPPFVPPEPKGRRGQLA